MIFGIGTDLIETSRIERLVPKVVSNDFKRQLARFAHPMELEAARKLKSRRRQVEFWAARWAAKEAFAKALGTGIGAKLAFCEMGVINSASGAPYFVFSRDLQKHLNQLKIAKVHVSLSHLNALASAFVVLESKSTKAR